MDNQITERPDKVEITKDPKQKDIWDKLQSLSGILIPVAIAAVGWYYTNENSRSQLEIQKLNNDNQFQIALVNSSVGQSELIKDFMQHLTSSDTTTRNIAIEAILYAAPAPGKKIVEALSRTSDKRTRSFAIDALATKRSDLAASLFSDQKQLRIITSNEIITNWSNDGQMLAELLNRTKSCLSNNESSPNCDEGIYNTLIVLPLFSRQLLTANKETILTIASQISPKNDKTKKLADEFIKLLPH